MVMLLFRVALVLVVSCAALVLAVRGLAYDAAYFADVRAALTPPADCPAPCFLGVRPGETSFGDAVALLEAHPWVDEIYMRVPRVRRTWIDVNWSGQQPDFIAGTGRLAVQDGVVVRFLVETKISFGIIWLAFGAPPRGELVRPYHTAAFDVRTMQRCADFWRAQTAILVTSASEAGEPYTPALRRAICRER